MKNDNELIAEFMSMKREVIFGKVCYDGYQTREYNTSWDWLMPVIRKVYELLMQNVDQHNKITDAKEREWDEHASRVVMLSITCNIEFAHRNVVEFIKWYNQPKP